MVDSPQKSKNIYQDVYTSKNSNKNRIIMVPTIIKDLDFDGEELLEKLIVANRELSNTNYWTINNFKLLKQADPNFPDSMSSAEDKFHEFQLNRVLIYHCSFYEKRFQLSGELLEKAMVLNMAMNYKEEALAKQWAEELTVEQVQDLVQMIVRSPNTDDYKSLAKAATTLHKSFRDLLLEP